MVINHSAPPGPIVPTLTYGDPVTAAAWLCRTFGFHEDLRWTDDDGVSIRLTVGGGALVLRPPRSEGTGENRVDWSAPIDGGIGQLLTIQVTEIDRHHERTVAAGARVMATPITLEHGEREYRAVDPWSHHWVFTESVADVSPDVWGAEVFWPRPSTRQLHADPALMAMFEAAERAYEQWFELEQDLVRKRTAYEASLRAEAELHDRLEVILDLVRDLTSGGTAEGASQRTAGSNAPRRRWWRRRPEPGGAISASGPAPSAGPLVESVPSSDSVFGDLVTNAPAPAPFIRHPAVRPIDDPERRSNAPTPPPMPGGAALSARLLGSFIVAQHGTPVTDWHGAKALTVLKYLLAHHDQAIPRDVLVELIWPDIDAIIGRRNLHQVVYSLRRTLRASSTSTSHIVLRHECYAIDPAIDVWCDVDEFDGAVSDGRAFERLQDAVAAIAAYDRARRLYLGDFLEDTPYDDWTVGERQRLRIAHHDLLDRLGELHVSLASWDEAIAVSQELLGRDPVAESAHRRIIDCYASKGQRNLAIHQYRYCVDALARDLGLPPSAATEAAYARVRG